VHRLFYTHISLPILSLNLIFNLLLTCDRATSWTKLATCIDLISFIQGIRVTVSCRLSYSRNSWTNTVIIRTILEVMELSDWIRINVRLFFLMETRLIDICLIHRLIVLINLSNTSLVLIITANRVTNTPISSLLTKLCLCYCLLGITIIYCWYTYWSVLEDARNSLLIYWWVEKVGASHHHLVLVLTLSNKCHYVWSLSLIYKTK